MDLVSNLGTFSVFMGVGISNVYEQYGFLVFLAFVSITAVVIGSIFGLLMFIPVKD